MRAVLLRQPFDVGIDERPQPGPPGSGEAQVRVLRVGVCGTDLHAFAGRQPMMAYPVVLGHELSVQVVSLGPDAPLDAAAPGTLCTLIPYVNCEDCIACERGLTNACVRLEVLGVHVDGGLTEVLNVPARLLLPAEGLDPEAVALVEMLAIGEHAARRADVSETDRVLIVGCGPIGMGAAAAANRRTTHVSLHDRDAGRLRFAAGLGLGAPVDAGEDLRAAAATVLGGLPDVVIDATGNAASMVSAAGLLGPGGRLALVGHTGGQLAFDNQTLHRSELTVLACRNATRADFHAVLEDLRAGRTDTTSWITHRVDLEELPSALPGWVERPAGLVKALVEVA